MERFCIYVTSAGIAQMVPDPIGAWVRYNEAVNNEHAAIVAWLREYGNHPPSPDCPRCQIADAIERGEHLAQERI